jgi:hypothetical protein
MRPDQKITIGCAALVLGIAFGGGHAAAQYGGPCTEPFAGPSSLNFNAETKGSQVNDSALCGAQTAPQEQTAVASKGLYAYAKITRHRSH